MHTGEGFFIFSAPSGRKQRSSRFCAPCAGPTLLLAFGRQEKELKRQNRFYLAHFFDDDVEKALKTGGKDMKDYDRDWLSFYDEKQIRERQKRWEEEARAEVSAREEEASARLISSVREPYVRQVYVGRNEPCPCGSGKKYKKCCLGK